MKNTREEPTTYIKLTNKERSKEVWFALFSLLDAFVASGVLHARVTLKGGTLTLKSKRESGAWIREKIGWLYAERENLSWNVTLRNYRKCPKD